MGCSEITVTKSSFTVAVVYNAKNLLLFKLFNINGLIIVSILTIKNLDATKYSNL